MASRHQGSRSDDRRLFDAHHETLSPQELDWFEALLEEQDVDIMAWAIGTQPCPPEWDGPVMQRMRALNFVPIAR